ncbi:maleylpyruvate isomerase family mycothiol-dependent enzyme [Streptomyces sp. NPDC093085]|uniref:maleylpyruvate isomerase family mycothiol-dependent enzyme n=1 Tax=Streptomyces sp. NPDC093085 TaxID=3155068 RepID=UPI0034141910
MTIAEHLRQLADEGALLGEAAAKADPGAEVPTCPDWRVRDLLGHIGRVHRWATRTITEGAAQPAPFPAEPELAGDALVEWYREGHEGLVTALRTAPADLACWTFFPTPDPLAFWARRQAHETAVHRADAESALGGGLSPVETGFAADGIDELLRLFHGRDRSRLRSPEPRVLRVRATDTDDVWTVRISADPAVTVRTTAAAEAPADGELSGPAGTLYLALWNRLPLDTLTATGDPELVRLWRETSGV